MKVLLCVVWHFYFIILCICKYLTLDFTIDSIVIELLFLFLEYHSICCFRRFSILKHCMHCCCINMTL